MNFNKYIVVVFLKTFIPALPLSEGCAFGLLVKEFPTPRLFKPKAQ